MLSAICSSGREIPYVLECNRGFESVPSGSEQEQEYMIYQVIAIGYPADSVKPGVGGTVFEGGIDDTYPRETAHDLFRMLCLEFTKYLRECQKELDKLLEFVEKRVGSGRQSLEDAEFLISFFNLSSVENARLLDDYVETLVPKKRKREVSEDVTFEEAQKEELRMKVKSSCLAALCKLRAYTEVIEKDTIDGSKQAYRVREVAAILRPSTVVCADFNDMLHRLCLANVQAELDAQVQRRPKVVESIDILEALGVTVRRKLRTETLQNGHEDWFHFCRTLLGPSSVAIQLLSAGDSDINSALRHANGLWKEDIGPWSEDWRRCDKLRGLCVESVLSFEAETGKLNYLETSIPPYLKFRAQIGCYMDSSSLCKVIDLSKVFGSDRECMQRNIFLLDFFENSVGPRSHIDAISFLCMWENLTEIESRKLGCVDSHVSAGAQRQDVCLATDTTRVHKLKRTIFKGTEEVDRTDTEKDKLRAKYVNMLQTEQLRIERLRKCAGGEWVSNSRGEVAQDAIDSYLGANGIVESAINHLFKNVVMDETVCESVRKVLCFGVDPQNQLANCKAPNRWVSCRFAPDMSEACNTLQKFMWLYEKLGVAYMHRVFLFMHQASYDSMIPHDGMFVNCLVYGAADCGKSYTLDLLEYVMIPGSYVTEQHMTNAAHRCHEGPQEMQVRAIHEVADHLEKPNTGKSNRDDPSSSRQDALKSELTENIVITNTPMPGLMENGKRQNLKYKKKMLRANMAGGNLSDPWSQVASAVLSRFFPIAALAVHAEGRNACDKNIQKNMSTEQWEKEESKEIQLYFRQQQWFFGLVGILLESGLLHPINEMAFQVALHQLNKSLKELNFAPASRMIHQARLMSRVIMLMGLFDSSFCRENGVLDGYFVPTDLLKLQDQMVMSMSNAWAGLQQVLVARLYVSELTAIMTAILQIIIEQKYGDYSSMFCTERRNAVDSSELLVDLDYVVLNIGQHARAWDSFCGVISQTLKSNKISKDQVKGHIKHLFLDNESPWLTVQQEDDLDLLLDTSSIRHLDLDYILPQNTPASLNAVLDLKHKHKLSHEVLSKKDMSRTHAAWVKAGASINCKSPFAKFFPYFTKKNTQHAPKRTWVNDLSQGIVKISTHAILLFCQKDYKRQFNKKLSAKSMQLSCVTNTHMAIVPSDLSGIHNHVPYLVDVQQIQSGKQSAEIVNQRYVNNRVHNLLQPRRERKQTETMPRFHIPADQALGLTCAQQHIRNLVQSRPENPPSVHRLFVADPEAINIRFAPYILQLALEAPKSIDKCKDCPGQRAIIHELLQINFSDFLWPVDENGLPWNASNTDAKHKFTNYLIDIVLELYHCKGIGKLAQTAANDIDIFSEEHNSDYSKMHNSRIAQAVESRSSLYDTPHVQADSVHPFLAQWKSLHQSDSHHVGIHYIQSVRKIAEQMIHKWRKTDYWWVSLLKNNKYIT